jgi:two-component system, chemotaxis family, CheB/CheR fusion protein
VNLLKMTRGSLLSELRRTITEAKERGVAVRADGVKVVRGDRTQTIAVEVLPLLPGREGNDQYFLVLFHDGTRAPPRLSPLDLDPGDAVDEARRLRKGSR